MKGFRDRGEVGVAARLRHWAQDVPPITTVLTARGRGTTEPKCQITIPRNESA